MPSNKKRKSKHPQSKRPTSVLALVRLIEARAAIESLFEATDLYRLSCEQLLDHFHIERRGTLRTGLVYVVKPTKLMRRHPGIALDMGCDDAGAEFDGKLIHGATMLERSRTVKRLMDIMQDIFCSQMIERYFNRTWLEKMDSGSGGFDVLFCVLVFERHRGEITQRAVAPRRVIEGFDVVEGGKRGGAPGRWENLFDSRFGFVGAPE